MMQGKSTKEFRQFSTHKYTNSFADCPLIFTVRPYLLRGELFLRSCLFVFASPPSEVSRYAQAISRPVSRMVTITESSDIFLVPDKKFDILAAFIARIAATALRSMHGICTSPPIGSQVSPRWCSMAISAAYSIWRRSLPSSSDRADAAIAHAVPISA